MKAFIQTIANMTQDGEPYGASGEPFIMENDDAIATLNDLIDHARTLVAKQKPKPKAMADDVKVIDGKTYYGRMVNYTTGAKMAYCSFPSDPKRGKRSKIIQALRDARAAGLIKPTFDWLPRYMQNMERSKELDAAMNAPRPKWEGESEESYKAHQLVIAAHDDAVQIAKEQMRDHKRYIFNA